LSEAGSVLLYFKASLFQISSDRNMQ